MTWPRAQWEKEAKKDSRAFYPFNCYTKIILSFVGEYLNFHVHDKVENCTVEFDQHLFNVERCFVKFVTIGHQLCKIFI